MKLSCGYFDFIDKLDSTTTRALANNIGCPFPYEPEKDDGKGL
jgi:hypothetical protein